jgi:hypothetical protein
LWKGYLDMGKRMRVVGAATIAATIALAGCGGDEDAVDSTTAPVASSSTAITATATTTTATEAVVGSDGLLVTYDGAVCDYSGPESLRLDDEVTATFVNDSEDDVLVVLSWVPPDRIDEFAPLVGTDFDFDPETDLPEWTIYVVAEPGEEGTTSVFLAADGTYVVECILFVGGQRSHIWWPAALEVTR